MGWFTSCEHDWESFRETVNVGFFSKNDPAYHKCKKCGKKEECFNNNLVGVYEHTRCVVCHQTIEYA